MKSQNILIAIFLYLIMSFSSVLMKIASAQIVLIYKLLLYCGAIGVLGIFAILWQKLLKNNKLSTVYVFKATTIIWGMLFGVCLFHETITLNMILGSLITVIGVAIIIMEGKNE